LEGRRASRGAMLERLGRSWSGALLDLLVIVGSILIAFALDAWWDGRTRASQEREALIALRAELDEARAELDTVLSYNRETVLAEEYFLGRRPADVSRLPEESIVLAARGLRGGMTFDPSVGAIEAIVSGGLDVVVDPALRAKIAAWPGALREIEVDQRLIVDRFEKMSDAKILAGLGPENLFIRRAWERNPTVKDSLRQALLGRLRSLLQTAAGDELLRGRVAGLAMSIEELLRELDDVNDRLAELQAAVQVELDAGA